MQLTGETPATGGHKVFISYARYDRERVQPLADALEAQGCSVWIDSNLVAGEVFAAEIEAALRSSTAVIVVWSETSVHSSWVRDEAGLARDLGRLVPVRIDDVAAPLGFGQFHMVNLTKWHGEPDARVIGEIMHAVTAVAHGTPLPMDPNGVAPVRRASPPRRLVLLGAGAALVPLAAGGAWWLNSRRAAPPAAVPAPAHSVAVLPFDNLSGDPGQDYFADGLSEEVRSALARIDSLQIAAPTSSNQFRGTKQDVAAIGRRLGVAFVLNGSVRRGGKMVRVTAQLSEAATGFERWSQTYDRSTADILKIQTDIAELVAGALKVKVMGVAPAVAIGQTTNPTAYDRYLLGRRALFGLSGDEATYREALQDFDVAVAADPSFAAAHALRARALIAIAGQFAKAAEIPALTRTALEAAQRAVTLAPDLDMAQSVLAFTRLYGALDVKGAAEPYEKSRELGQGDADVLQRYGLYAARTGRFDAAMTALQRAAVLDPLNPSVQMSLSAALYAARRFGEAIAPVRRALALSPKMNFAHGYIGDCLLLMGRLNEALTEYDAEPSALGRLPGLAIVQRKLGDAPASEAAFARLVADLGDGALYQQAQVLAQWGRSDAALDMLDKAWAARDTGLVLLNTDPLLDGLRRTDRFMSLRNRLGFA